MTVGFWLVEVLGDPPSNVQSHSVGRSTDISVKITVPIAHSSIIVVRKSAIGALPPLPTHSARQLIEL